MKSNARLTCTLLAVAAALAACGAAADPEPKPTVTTTVETDVEVADEKADRPLHWTVKADELQLWVYTTLRPEWDVSGTTWVLTGEVNEDLTSARAYDATGRAFPVTLLDSRTFEVAFGPDEAIDLVAGERIYLDFFAASGTTSMFHGTVRFAPRFTRWAGSRRLYVLRAINPVLVGGELRFRARANAQRGHELMRIFTDDDLTPLIAEEKPRKYRFDWSPRALMLAADPPEEPVYFEISDGAETVYRKQAGIDLRITQIGLTTGHPMGEWPPPRCEDGVLHCLEQLDDHSDTEACGYANEVSACLGRVELPLAADEERFRADLAEEIEAWYASRRAPIRPENARTLRAALHALHHAPIHRLQALEHGDTFPWDVEYYDVFWVNDPIQPDSKRVWYGVYEPSGIRRTIFAVN